MVEFDNNKNEREERAAAFNDAVGSLETLREINRMMVQVSTYRPSVRRQVLMIDLLKSYFRSCSFLMDDGGNSFEKDINSLKIDARMRKGKKYFIYSENLDTKINSIMRKIQFKIKNYLMPSGRDPRFTWKQE